MWQDHQLALSDAGEWLGDWHPLVEQLGSAIGLHALGSVSRCLRLRPVQDVSSLGQFLATYQTRILLPIELPVIHAAHGHASRNELRELVALDQQLQNAPVIPDLAAASRRVGRYQLRKLRPLRDQRLVQRYLSAVDGCQANGWHTLVYGLTLAIYSLPLRQGLLGYAQQTIRGFIYSAASPLQLSERQCRNLFDNFCEGLPVQVHGLLDAKPVISSFS